MFVPSVSFGQVFVQTQVDTRFSKQSAVPTGTIFVAKNFKESKWGISMFGLFTPNQWGEAYAGPTYQVNSKLKLGVSVGGELTTAKPRFAASAVRIGSKSFGALFLEQGTDSPKNYWYSLQILTRTDKKVQPGLRIQRFYGAGPQVGIQVSKNSKIIVAPLYEMEQKQFQPTVFWQYVW